LGEKNSLKKKTFAADKKKLHGEWDGGSGKRKGWRFRKTEAVYKGGEFWDGHTKKDEMEGGNEVKPKGKG